MSEQFDDWVKDTASDYHNRPGIITGRLHALTNYHAQQGAKLAWDHQQRKIDELVAYLSELVDVLGDGCQVANVRAVIAKEKGETE